MTAFLMSRRRRARGIGRCATRFEGRSGKLTVYEAQKNEIIVWYDFEIAGACLIITLIKLIETSDHMSVDEGRVMHFQCAELEAGDEAAGPVGQVRHFHSDIRFSDLRRVACDSVLRTDVVARQLIRGKRCSRN